MMIELNEKEWRMTLASCACAVKGSAGAIADDHAISIATEIMNKCGLFLSGNPVARNTVEPEKCTICKQYIWPHEERTDDKHKRCNDGIALRTQAGR